MQIEFTKNEYSEKNLERFRKATSFERKTILVNYSRTGRFSTPASISGYLTSKAFYCIISVSNESLSLISVGKCNSEEFNYKHWAIEDALKKAGVIPSISLPNSNISHGDIEREVLDAIAHSLKLENYTIISVLP